MCVQDYLDYGNLWALGALTFASVGLHMTTILMRLSLELCVCAGLSGLREPLGAGRPHFSLCRPSPETVS
jgi:hypothetical protein